jgi:hypothetical protein
VLAFRLKRKARVLFTVVQVSPVCRTAGSFSVVGRRGINRVRFNGKVHGRRLSPGTYRISARTADSQAVLRLVLVIVESGRSSSAALAAARQSDVCSLAGRDSVGDGISAAANHVAGEGSVEDHSTKAAQVVRGPNTSPSAIGPNVGLNKLTNPLAFALLGLAVLLLRFAALPEKVVPDPRLTDGLARHRAQLAVGGTVLLAAAIVALVSG